MSDGSNNTQVDENRSLSVSPDLKLLKDGGDADRTPPPLPPRPKNLTLLHEGSNVAVDSPQSIRILNRPKLQSRATTAISRPDIHIQSHQDGSSETYDASDQSTLAGKSWLGLGGIRRFELRNASDGDDSASVRSYTPTLGAAGDAESLLGELLVSSQHSPDWKILDAQFEAIGLAEPSSFEDKEDLSEFNDEFDEIGELSADGTNESDLLHAWKSKRKHFLILSSAGKPIYSRHGSDNLISGYVGVVQAIISFYENFNDQLKGFTAAGVRFVVMAQGPLYLVAISKLEESDAQLRAQLDALYMQILSTLTLPNLVHRFSNRPSTDLRRPLQGTEPLLSALADSFTRGSASTLLSALECLQIRKFHRKVIMDTLLQKRCDTLLYGLIVAGGRLVSVVRPRRHSLHPGDLQLIFNMLFEAEGVKAGGGENWIPLCLPGFNKNGYLYMYVSFLDASGENVSEEQPGASRQDEIAILLISADKESFFDLRSMRDAVVEELENNGSLNRIRSAINQGRFATTDIVPGTVLNHFLYKSRANVQFIILMSIYHILHSSVHAKNSHLKVQHCVSRDSISLAWVTPSFELYCVAGSSASRNALAQSASAVVRWARKEEGRIFIIGGAVF
ncbi:MAG: hypothetical protein LQ351_000895 [Letrouitia transgressa]|nr:MAG: hypothetical protein LQ351_000895 [Letrouitia transgressa]